MQKQNIINFYNHKIDISKLTNIYESILISDGEGGTSAISIEFYNLNQDKLEKLGYVLNFVSGSKRLDISFDTKEELNRAIKELYKYI